MANLTISVDEEVLRRARIRALEDNTSVNAVLGAYLNEYARLEEVRRGRLQALERLRMIAESHPIDSGGRAWSRDELYDR